MTNSNSVATISRDDFKTAFAKAKPGERVAGRIQVGSFASSIEIFIPFLIMKGARTGPCMWVNGHVHGTEINGTWAALDFFWRLDPAELSGTVVVTPTANPLAMDARRKTAPQDEQDLDQTFPGNRKGLLSDQLSAALFEQVSAHADLLVSLHTMGPLFVSEPYGVYKVHPESTVSEEQLLRLLRHFHPTVACRMSVAPGAGELPGNVPGAIDYQMLALGKPAFMVELGFGNSTDPACIEQGALGLIGVAAESGLLSKPARAPAASLKRVTRRTHVMTSVGGLFRARVGVAAEVAAGDAIGEIVSIYGEVLTEVSLPGDIVTIGVRRDPIVHTGDRCAFVALEWDNYDVR
jgi:predicted deacylase